MTSHELDSPHERPLFGKCRELFSSYNPLIVPGGLKGPTPAFLNGEDSKFKVDLINIFITTHPETPPIPTYLIAILDKEEQTLNVIASREERDIDITDVDNPSRLEDRTAELLAVLLDSIDFSSPQS